VTSKDSPGLLENVRSWNPAPPVCSVNVGSDVDPWVDLLQVLTSRTIAVEAGVANVTMIDAVNADPSVFCHAVVLADAEDRMSATRRYLQLRDSLREGGFDRRIIAHAYGDATWGVLATALACGDHVRVGFEDTPTLPTGRPAHSNGELVEILVQLARALGRTPLTPSDLSTDPTISTARAPRPLVS
jgi:hypothetical protein